MVQWHELIGPMLLDSMKIMAILTTLCELWPYITKKSMPKTLKLSIVCQILRLNNIYGHIRMAINLSHYHDA